MSLVSDNMAPVILYVPSKLLGGKDCEDTAIKTGSIGSVNHPFSFISTNINI